MNNPSDISQEQYKALLAGKASVPASHWTTHLRGQRHERGRMNKTEAMYALYLDSLESCGAVLWSSFESMNLRLAKKTWFLIDFLVMAPDLTLECHEVKGGFWADDARVKIKVAASMYPFRFLAAQHEGSDPLSGWKIEKFSNE